MVYLQPVSPTNSTNQSSYHHHHRRQHHHHPYPAVQVRMLCRHILIAHTLYLLHTACSCHASTLTHSTCTTSIRINAFFSPLQIHAKTNILSVAVYQTQYVRIRILVSTSSRNAAASAPPPVRHPHLTASQCGTIEVHKQTPI